MALLNPSLHALPAATTSTVRSASPGGGSACSAIHLTLRLPHLAGIREQATEISKGRKTVPKKITEVADKADFQAEILRRTLILEAKHRDQGFVSDRCVVDNLAYALQLPNYPELFARTVEHLAKEPYTHVFLVKIAFPLVDNGVRSMDPGRQDAAERNIEKLLLQFCVPYRTVQSADRQGRVDEVLAAVAAPAR